jgi:ATP-dependent RNA circularization protein (DNA/RNA ligase family)
VISDFYKFPSTPHLALLGDVDIRGDKVMSESDRNDFLQHKLVIEEKVDGANLGISFDAGANIRAQNRGSYLHLPAASQWIKLNTWLGPRTDKLFEQLADRYILFGEWCYAQHSVSYDQLPDWFLGFDIYDKITDRFFSCARRDEMFRKIGISPVPEVARGHFSLSELNKHLSQSRLSSQPAEGLYLRFDHRDWLAQRAKLVRPAFIQSIEQHWSRSGIKPNRLVAGTAK